MTESNQTSTRPHGLEILEVEWSEHRDKLAEIRFLVFVQEQNVPQEIELDEMDAVSRHLLATIGDKPVGTGRLLPDGHIGRVAVLRACRRQGIGQALMHDLVEMGRVAGFSRLLLSAQVSALTFYRGLGFIEHGDSFMEAGIEHLEMELLL